MVMDHLLVHQGVIKLMGQHLVSLIKALFRNLRPSRPQTPLSVPLRQRNLTNRKGSMQKVDMVNRTASPSSGILKSLTLRWRCKKLVFYRNSGISLLTKICRSPMPLPRIIVSLASGPSVLIKPLERDIARKSYRSCQKLTTPSASPLG